MTYKGHIQDGAVVFEGPVCLPEGAKVEVAIREDDTAPIPQTMAERFADLISSDNDLPPDAAGSKRRYLYGHAG